MAKYTTYFDKPPEGWSFLGFYQHRHNEKNVILSFMKESYILKNALRNTNGQNLAKSFKPYEVSAKFIFHDYEDAPRDVPLTFRVNFV
ncbi:6960_t:CDS:2, partial [Paraglomus occultum]